MIKHIPQKGFTLIEIMIALIIGLFLTAGAIEIFTSTKNNNRLQENLSRMQENARFAMQFLRDDIQRASFDGAICGRGRIIDTATNNVSGAAIGTSYSFKTLPMVGAPSTASGVNSLSNAISGLNGVGLSGADRLIIRALGATKGVKLTADMADKLSDLQINASEAGLFQQGDIALVTNCIYGDIFQITDDPSSGVLKHQTGSSETPDNHRSELGFAYKKINSKVYKLSANTGLPYVFYDIANSGTPAVPGLAKGTGTQNAGPDIAAMQQLVPDIEDMQIEYGQRLAGGAIAYVPAGTAGLDFNNVISVKINLLVRSQDDFIAISPQPSFIFNDVSVIPVDRRLRKVYTSTITTRNRLN